MVRPARHLPVLYRINDELEEVVVHHVEHRHDFYRPLGCTTEPYMPSGYSEHVRSYRRSGSTSSNSC